jgi:transketolase
MKKTFIHTLTTLARRDERIYLLTGDLGFPFFSDFAREFPRRSINCGVAEQNMVGVAAGLALEGKKVYVYSIIPFLVIRCLEQIRNDICYQNLDVKLIGVGEGFSYGDLGATHYAIEDIGILRTLPNITILSPADLMENEQLLLKSYQTENPTYIRLARSGKKTLHHSLPQIEIGNPLILSRGKDGALIATGPQVISCLEAVKKLKKLGYNFTLLGLPTLKPFNGGALLKEVGGLKNIFTVEEHNIIGGVGSIVAEVLAESGWQGRFKRLGVPDEYPSQVGTQEYLQRKYRLSSKEMIKFILDQIE